MVGISRVDEGADMSDSVRRTFEKTRRRGLADLYSQAPNPNLLDNAQFEVCQRGYTAGVPIGSTILSDRWVCSNSATGTSSVLRLAQASFGSGSMPAGRPRPPNIQYVQVTTAETPIGGIGDYHIVGQNVEGQALQHLKWSTAEAKPVTVSFDVYCNIAGTFILELYLVSTGRSCSLAYTTTAGAWKTVTLTFPGDTGGTYIANDSNGGIGLQFWQASGTTFSGGATLQTSWGTTTNARAVDQTNLFATLNNVFAVTNVKFEVGAVATAFEPSNYRDEYLRCARYLRVFHGGAPLRGVAGGTLPTRMGMVLDPPMRAAPTYSVLAGTPGFWDGVTGAVSNAAPSISWSTAEVAEFDWNAAALAVFVAGRAVVQYQVGGVVVALSAEI
jgi:hypothetical protein